MTRRGFSLVEVLIGVALFLIGFVPIIVLLFGSEKAAVETQRGVQQVQYAHVLLEDAAALPYAMIPATTRVSDADFIDRVTRARADKGGGTLFDKPDPEYAENFERSIEVVEYDGDIKRIKVTVIDKHVAADTAGKRGESCLETLVIR